MSSRRPNGGAAASRPTKTPAAPAAKGGRASMAPTSSAVRGGRASVAPTSSAVRGGRDSGATVASAVRGGRDSGATVTKSGRDSVAATSSARSGRNPTATATKSSRDSAATAAKSGQEPAATEAAAAVPAVKPVKYCPRPRPPRGFSAMTDDRQAAAVDAATCGPPCCVPNGCVKPEGHYACDRQEAKVLAQYVTPEERAKVLRWLDALQRLQRVRRGAADGGEDQAAADDDGDGDVDDDDEQSERSMYMTCLLMLLRSGRLIAPFTRSPPRPLRPLRDVVDRHLYKRVQVECRRRRLHVHARYSRPGDGGDDDDGDGGRANGPAGFFDRMPEPCGGVFCYGAAFSDMS